MPHSPDSGFDRVTSFYDPLARFVFGDAQQQAQKVLLPFIKNNASILVIGGGSGWLLEQLLYLNKDLHIVYLDASPNMIRLAKKKTKQHIRSSSSRVEFRTGTEKDLLPGELFDVVFTPFLLDLFPAQRLNALMSRLESALQTDGLWLFADFWPVKQPAPLWQRCLLKAMYIFFDILSNVKATQLPDFKTHFRQLNMQKKFSATYYKGMIQAKVFSKQPL